MVLPPNAICPYLMLYCCFTDKFSRPWKLWSWTCLAFNPGQFCGVDAGEANLKLKSFWSIWFCAINYNYCHSRCSRNPLFSKCMLSWSCIFLFINVWLIYLQGYQTSYIKWTQKSLFLSFFSLSLSYTFKHKVNAQNCFPILIQVTYLC